MYGLGEGGTLSPFLSVSSFLPPYALHRSSRYSPGQGWDWDEVNEDLSQPLNLRVHLTNQSFFVLKIFLSNTKDIY